MVSDLIDPMSKTWKIDVISIGFYREDVTPILSIPLSRNGCRDKLVWHHSENGTYTVISGYKVTFGLMENGALGRKMRGSPSLKTKLNQVWNKIWSLEVPNKMKFLVWKFCNNVLAVRRNLQIRHKRVDNICGVCKQFDETENHIFFRCEFSHLF